MQIFCYFCLTNITDDVTTNCTFHPGSKDKKLIQVSWKMSDPSTLKREIEAFQSAAEYLNATEKLIVTWDKEKTLENNIKVIPAWKFLLEKY